MLKIETISLPTPWPPVGEVHTYLIKDDPLTLIDTGLNTPESRTALIAGLQRCGVRPEAIKRVLITHAHWDHYGQAAWFREVAGAQVYIHPWERPKADNPAWWLQGRERLLQDAGVPAELMGFLAEMWQRAKSQAMDLPDTLPLEDGQTLAFAGGELTAVHLPGHAPGHTGFYEAASQTLIGGDHLLQEVTPNPIAEPLPEGHPAGVPHAPYRAFTLGQFLGALEKVAALAVRQVLPGHGPVITDHQGVIAYYQRSHQKRLDRLADLLGARPTVFELTQQVYPKVRRSEMYLAMSEVLAHLDFLVVAGRARGERDGELYRFHAV